MNTNTNTPKTAAEYQAEINAEFERRQNERKLAEQEERAAAYREACRKEIPSLVRQVPLD